VVWMADSARVSCIAAGEYLIPFSSATCSSHSMESYLSTVVVDAAFSARRLSMTGVMMASASLSWACTFCAWGRNRAMNGLRYLGYGRSWCEAMNESTVYSLVMRSHAGSSRISSSPRKMTDESRAMRSRSLSFSTTSCHSKMSSVLVRSLSGVSPV